MVKIRIQSGVRVDAPDFTLPTKNSLVMPQLNAGVYRVFLIQEPSRDVQTSDPLRT